MSDTPASFGQLADVARLALTRGDRDGARASLASAFNAPSLADAIESESAESLLRLGLLYQDAGLEAEAERLFGDAVAVAETTLGKNDIAVAQALSCLGTRLVARGANDEAEPLLRRALSISEQVLGEDHTELNGLLNVLSRLYLKQGAFASAGQLLDRLLALKLVKGEEHPEVATVLASLALVRQGLGDHEGAEMLGRRVLQIREKTLAPNHYAIASALELLADECAARGKVVEAGTLYQRALNIREQTLGVSHASLRVLRERIVDLQLQAADLASDESFSPMLATPAASYASPAQATTLKLQRVENKSAPPPVSPGGSLPPTLSIARTAADIVIPVREERRDVVEPKDQEEGRQQSLVLPNATGILSLRQELASMEEELSDEAAAALATSPIQRLLAAISASLATRRGQAMAGGAAALVLVVTILGMQSNETSETIAGTSPVRSDVAAVTSAPAVSTTTRDADDSASRIVRTSAGSIALRTVSTAPSSQPIVARASESRSESPSARKTSDDAPALDLSHVVKIAAPTIAVGRADSIARASEAPGTIGDGSFSRQFWTAGIDKRAGSEAATGPTPARLIGEMPHPVYPEFLRKSSVGGEVVVQFVIDVTGRPDMATLEVVRTPHEAMTAAVRRVVQQMRFEPARSGGADGQPRTELVQISFVFQTDAK